MTKRTLISVASAALVLAALTPVALRSDPPTKPASLTIDAQAATPRSGGRAGGLHTGSPSAAVTEQYEIRERAAVTTRAPESRRLVPLAATRRGPVAEQLDIREWARPTAPVATIGPVTEHLDVRERVSG